MSRTLIILSLYTSIDVYLTEHTGLQSLGILPPNRTIKRVTPLGPFLDCAVITASVLNLEYGFQVPIWFEIRIGLGNRCQIGCAHDALANGVDTVLYMFIYQNIPILQEWKLSYLGEAKKYLQGLQDNALYISRVGSCPAKALVIIFYCQHRIFGDCYSPSNEDHGIR